MSIRITSTPLGPLVWLPHELMIPADVYLDPESRERTRLDRLGKVATDQLGILPHSGLAFVVLVMSGPWARR